jgi:hypothetical protein
LVEFYYLVDRVDDVGVGLRAILPRHIIIFSSSFFVLFLYLDFFVASITTPQTVLSRWIGTKDRQTRPIGDTHQGRVSYPPNKIIDRRLAGGKTRIQDGHSKFLWQKAGGQKEAGGGCQCCCFRGIIVIDTEKERQNQSGGNHQQDNKKGRISSAGIYQKETKDDRRCRRKGSRRHFSPGILCKVVVVVIVE